MLILSQMLMNGEKIFYLVKKNKMSIKKIYFIYTKYTSFNILNDFIIYKKIV